MSVFSQHTHFRHQFAVKGLTIGNVSFVQGTPDTITTVAGDFTVDGLLAGHSLDVVGSASNDGRWPIASVVALTITLETSNQLTNEGPVAVTMTGSFIDPDGYDRWPVDYVRLAASGFGDAGSTITGIPTPYAATQFSVSCNGLGADSVKDTPEYHWYLSQRTDTPANQYLTISQYPNTATDSYSGTVNIVHTALAETTFGFTGASDFTAAMVPLLFRHCHLYVMRISDNAIQWVDLLRAMTAAY